VSLGTIVHPNFRSRKMAFLTFQSSTDLASSLMWIDAKGKELGEFHAPQYVDPAFSPDGRFLAGACDQAGTGTLAICVHDRARGIHGSGVPSSERSIPCLVSDGREIACNSGGIYRISADGSGTPAFVSNRGIPTGWSRDGRILSFGSHKGVVSLALWSPTTHDPWNMGPGGEAQLSPDATWMAYIAKDGLVVQRFPEPTKRVQITGYGSSQPQWSRDGRQLFYITSDEKLSL
jgi:hypothetical protein